MDKSLAFFRQRSVQKFEAAHRMGKRVILVEAQAGQGKSTLVLQFLTHSNHPFVWYQIAAEDSNSVLFFKTMYEGLTKALAGFSSQHLGEMIKKNELVHDDLDQYAATLAKELNAFLEQEVYLVFDDIHLLDAADRNPDFKETFFSRSNAKLRYILISRQPVSTIIPWAGRSDRSMSITGRDLAMTRNEIAGLLLEHFDLPLSREKIRQLHRETEGWIMGLLIKAHAMAGSGDMKGDCISGGHSRVPGEMKAYFAREVFKSFSRKTLRHLARLSLVERIPFALAPELTGDQGSIALLNTLVSKNYFTRYVNLNRNLVCFHHLFQECLRDYAGTCLDPAEHRAVFEKTARWHLDQGNMENGICYYIRAGNLKAADETVRDSGLDIYARNRFETVIDALEGIPEDRLGEYGCLSCLYGMACLNTHPPEALRFFTKANSLFTKDNDTKGMLTARTQLIYYHVWVDCMFNRGREYLDPAASLYAALEASLPVHVKLSTLYCLVCGYAFIESDIPRAGHYAALSLSISTDHRLDNYTAMIRLLRCYLHGFTGTWQGFYTELEQLNTMCGSQRISSYNRMLIHMARINILEMEGDFFNYCRLRDHLQKKMENNLAFKSTLDPFLHIWDMDMALAKGDIEGAGKIIQRALNLPYAGENPHFKSQFCHYQALIEALGNRPETARDAAHEALELRREIGSPYFTMLTRVIAGAALAASGREKQGEDLLLKAVKRGEPLQDSYLLTAACAHLAATHLNNGGNPAPWVKRLLCLMKENRYTHFFSRTPEMMTSLLDWAVKNGIEADTARSLAADTLNTAYGEDGRKIPILTIQTLGRLAIRKGDQTLLTAKDLTGAQQKLMAMLVSSHHAYINAEGVQACFWPETTPSKSRASFDTMISRMRKLLKKALAPLPVKDYFSLKKEQLALTHVKIDVKEFMRQAEQGLRLAETGSLFQAENRFRAGFHLWEGFEFLPGLTLDHRSYKFKEYTLQPLFSDAIRTWSRIAAQNPDVPDRDLETMEKAVAVDSSNVELVKNIYHIYVDSGLPVRASRLLALYRDTLRAEGFYAEEIDDILEELWA